MKFYRQIIFIFIILFAAVFLYACGQSEYTLTFEADGAEVSSFTAEEGEKIVFPSPPLKGGYTFGGWFKDDETFADPFDSSVMPKENLTVYALWTPDAPAATYTISFDSNGGSAVSPLTAETGQTVSAPEPPTREGYTFGGWYKDNGTFADPFVSSVKHNEDMTLYALWNPGTYTISFDSNGGSAVSPMTAETGQTLSAPEAPIKEGFTFGGWYRDDKVYKEEFIFSAMPGEDLIVYAKWEGLSAVELLWASRSDLFFEIWGELGAELQSYMKFTDIDSGHNDALVAANFLPWIYEYTPANAAAIDARIQSLRYLITTPFGYKQIPDTDIYVIDDLLSLYDILTGNPVRVDGSYYNEDQTLLIRANTEATTFQIPYGVTTIGGAAFSGSEMLQTVSMPETVHTIGMEAFAVCRELASISFPQSLHKISSMAFVNCNALTTVHIPNGVTEIGDGAFGFCSSLTTVTIPSGVTKIGMMAFSWAGQLHIYAEPSSKPGGWANDWNSNESNVSWNAKEKTYQFDSNGGTEFESITAVVLTELPTPEREGFTFVGWYWHSEFYGMPITAPYYAGADITLYAKWE